MSKRKLVLAFGWVAAIVTLAVGQRALESQQPMVEAPKQSAQDYLAFRASLQ